MHTGRVSLYSELLANALDDYGDDSSVEMLVGSAAVFRAVLRAPVSAERGTPFGALATEIAYDCALIKLCALLGCEVAASSFEVPSHDRRRMERAIARAGIDLDGPKAR